MADAHGELLAVLVDTNLLHTDGSMGLQADVVMQQLLLFLKAHQLVSEHNHLIVIALQPNNSPVVYTPTSNEGSDSSMAQVILHRMQHLLQQDVRAGADGQQHEVSLSGGLSRALCYISRYAARYAASPRHQAKPRILCLLSAGDTPMQYIPVMNCIFAAQQTGVVIDALVVGQADSALLQQAAHITGGLYVRPQVPQGLLQYLLGAFSADTATRAALNVGSGAQAVDYRASCFCHKTVVDQAWICSVCLSIFCKANMKLLQCPTCGSDFKPRGAAQASAGRGVKG